MKKILLVLTNIVTPNYAIFLKKIGYDVVEFVTDIDDFDITANKIEEIVDFSFYAVWMYNYIPQIAEVCNRKNILYVCWMVDYPCFSLESDTVKYNTNRIFSFERMQIEKTRKTQGVDIFYQPLGTDITFFDCTIKNGGLKDYNGIDISFVGNLYNSTDRNLYLAVKYLPDYVRGYINGIVSSQLTYSSGFLSAELITPKVEQELRRYIQFNIDGYSFDYLEKICEMLQREAARVRRCEIVSVLSRCFDFKLFTGSDTSFDELIRKERYIDYKTEMPLVFKESKINLNITIDSIATAIPQRALDIMACGGFLLSDYREDLAQYYIDEEECVIYRSIEELVDKADFYLKHEGLRMRIAQKGYAKTKRDFSLEAQLLKIKNKLEEME